MTFEVAIPLGKLWIAKTKQIYREKVLATEQKDERQTFILRVFACQKRCYIKVVVVMYEAFSFFFNVMFNQKMG